MASAWWSAETPLPHEVTTGPSAVRAVRAELAEPGGELGRGPGTAGRLDQVAVERCVEIAVGMWPATGSIGSVSPR